MLICHLYIFFSFSFFFFLRRSFAVVTQTGVQWHDPSSPQPPPPGFKQFSCLSLPTSTGVGRLIFIFLSRDQVSPCWSGWSQTPNLVICPPQPHKVLRLQAEPPCLAWHSLFKKSRVGQAKGDELKEMEMNIVVSQFVCT